MAGMYEYQPEVKWYHILWDMRNKDFRQWYIKKRRRDLHLYWKYERHIFFQKAGGGLLIAMFAMTIFGSDIAQALVRWPTEDPNELLKQPVWQKYHNESLQRKEQVSKMLEDSNYVHKKNNPGQ